jgi:paraquat-inducible protein B
MDPADAPEAVAKGRARWSLPAVWLVPVVAALLAGWLGVKAVLERGPTITIRFKSADGIEAGKTKLKYKNVQIGVVRSVTVAPDLKEIIATAELAKEVKPYLVEDTRFWVVKPRIAGGVVSGLDTLLSGAYIGVDAGKSSTHRREFVGLDAPPVVTGDSPGTPLVLRAASAGSFEVGSPVFFRRLQAGQVTGYQLEGDGVKVSIFIDAPFDQYVNGNTRFWHASGVDVKLDANGVQVDAQSLVSILIGGIAFETPSGSVPAARAAAAAEFRLFENRAAALKNPESDKLEFTMVFDESVRGLQPGAPVDFRGISIGEVSAVRLHRSARGGILVAVQATMYPSRIQWDDGGPATAGSPERRRRAIDGLVASGMRAQLRPASLLTHQLYVALDFFPARGAKVNWAASPPELPTQKGTLVELESAIGSLAAKLDRLPLDELGGDLRQTLQSAVRLMDSIDAEVASDVKPSLAQLRKTLATAERALSSDSPLQTDTRQAMREVARAAQAFRVLADYLERHPEALIVGKREEASR